MSEGVKDKCSSREEIEKETTETLFGTSVNEKSTNHLYNTFNTIYSKCRNEMFENHMIYNDIQITIEEQTKDIKSWLTDLNRLLPLSILSISPRQEEYNTAMRNIAILLRCANLNPASTTTSSGPLIPPSPEGTAAFKSADGIKILNNINIIDKDLQDIVNKKQLTLETKITEIKQKSLSDNLASLVLSINYDIARKQIKLTPEEEKVIMQQLDNLKQKMSFIQQRYIKLKYQNLKAAALDYTEAQFDPQGKGTREIKDKIITELDTLKSYINGSDGPLFISAEARSKIYKEIEELKSSLEQNLASLNTRTLKTRTDPRTDPKTAKQLHDALGGGRTRRRQKKQRKQKKTQKRHKKRTNKRKQKRHKKTMKR
jgi:hypothetical protein